MKHGLFTLILLLSPAALFAAEAGSEPSLLTAALKLVAALAVIIGLLLLIYAASRKGFGVLPKSKMGTIKVVETRPLGGKKFLCLVSVRGEELLLGISHDRIDCLTKLPPAQNFDTSLQEQIEERQA